MGDNKEKELCSLHVQWLRECTAQMGQWQQGAGEL